MSDADSARDTVGKPEVIGRNCIDCKHLELEAGFGGGDLTPPDPMTWECGLGHYDISQSEIEKERVRSLLHLAKTCPDFDAEGEPAAPSCTGLTARWCPNHGTCCCPMDQGGLCGSLDDQNCPLHQVGSSHPR